MPPRAQIRFQAVKIAKKNKDDQMGDDSPQSSTVQWFVNLSGGWRSATKSAGCM